MDPERVTLTPLIAISTYEEALDFIDGLDVSAMKLGLERVRKLLETLGDPQDSLPMVHVAGTNGKGSVTAMLSSVLKAAGLTVGTFTSPHLVHVRERIAINGNPILSDDFVEEVDALKRHLESLEAKDGWSREDWPTYFEFLNVMAYCYFKRRGVDVTVFETGLGGRLDSTSIVKRPNLTVITGIGMDHMQHLGDTLEKIAAEKAGILKAGSPLVLGPEVPEAARAVILEKAAALEVPVLQAESQNLRVDECSSPEDGLIVQDLSELVTGGEYRLSLLGPYQKSNLAVVLACVNLLRQQGFAVTEDALRAGLLHTYWPVRFQYVAGECLLLDGSHNPDGFQSLADGLQLYFSGRPMAWLISLRANRDPENLLALLKRFGPPLAVIITRAEPQRLYHPPAALQAQVKSLLGEACPVLTADQPTEALARLRTQLSLHRQADPLGVVTGSLYTAGAILQEIERGTAIAQAQP